MAAPANSRQPNELVVKREDRKPLFGNRASNENQKPTQPQPGSARRQTDRMNTNSLNNNGYASPHSRIPKAGSGGAGSGSGFGSRKKMTLKEAYELAGGEGSSSHPPLDGSPSPAPRPWRESRLRRAQQDAANSPSKERWNSNSNGNSDQPQSGRNFSDEIDGLPKLVPGIEDVPLTSVEASPAKSFNWDMETDFTGGDLQVSDSPRIRTSNVNTKPFGMVNSPPIINPGSNNTKLAEIRSWELGLPGFSPAERHQNNKISEIHAREQRAEKDIPIKGRFVPRSGRTKLDEVRQLEESGLSRRAVAAARLAEIKEMNSMSRSLSPDEMRAGHRNRRDKELAPTRSRSAFAVGGTRVPDTPVTIFKSRRDAEVARPIDGTSTANTYTNKTTMTRRDQDLLRRLARASASPAHDQEAELETALHREKSPARQKRLSDRSDSKPTSLRRALGAAHVRTNSDNSEKDSKTSKNGDIPSKPTVGFATDSRRSSSNESAKSKRSSMFSDPDPTDRLASENKLFAPSDNYSEKGSVRAPSPLPDDDDETDHAAEATPRQTKPDPLTMPTPRITGAYVETPLTVKPERKQEPEPVRKVEDVPDPATIFRDKDTSRKRSDSVSSKTEEAVETKQRSQSRSRSRSRSTSRRRQPLKNSAKLPSVRDDLLELQRMHNMEDTTIENLEEILAGRKPTDEQIDELLKNVEKEDLATQIKQEVHEETTGEALSRMSTSLETATSDALDKMSQSLEAGILGIRDAKQDVERMERLSPKKPSKVTVKPEIKTEKRAQKQQQEHQHQHHDHHKHHHIEHDDQCPLCAKQQPGTVVAYVHFPVPRLYHRAPSFRLTLLGLVLFLVSLWYAAESATCYKYCRPTSCPLSKPCVFSYDDPSFGYAIPVKIDQLLTDGRGRIALEDGIEEARDWLADLTDSFYGRSILDVDVANLSFDDKRRHRRRLRKKGLLKPKELTAEQQAKWEGWRRERIARERAKEAREMNNGAWEDDERVW